MGTLFDRALAAILVLLRAPRCDCSVGVITTTDCRSADPDTFREFGTQLSASMVMLMRMRSIFPDWAGYLVTNRESWRHPNCEAAWQDLSGLYREKFRDDVKLVHFHVHHFKFLEIFAKVPGKETDHSRGHWPVEAYVHLVIGARLLEEYGHDHTVYVDPDAYTGRRVRDRFTKKERPKRRWPLDDALRFEVPLVTGIGCIAALPAKCLEMGPPPPNLQAHLVTGGVPGREVQKVVKMARERADEYRLVADPDHRAAVVAAAKRLGFGYAVRNGTNSGVVVYNNRFLRDSDWAGWLHALINVTSRGFYGDQTALSVALGRSDVDARRAASAKEERLRFDAPSLGPLAAPQVQRHDQLPDALRPLVLRRRRGLLAPRREPVRGAEHRPLRLGPQALDGHESGSN